MEEGGNFAIEGGGRENGSNCWEKKCPQIHYTPTFLLIIYREENQMSLQYSESPLDALPQLLDHLLASLPHQTPPTPASLAEQPTSKEIELYTQSEARQVLVKLIEKSKASAQRKNWKVDETNYLLFVIEKYCLVHDGKCEQLGLLDWISISKFIPNRDGSACQFRYLSLFPKSISNVPWSSYERQLLLRIIQNQNSNCLNWKLISETLYHESKEKTYRTGKQCREHYTCFLQPNLKKGAWTDEEDYQLITLFLKLGKKWSKMTKFIDGRNENSIKNRFFLMFQNKKDVRLTNSDLVKMARRRKEKLEKKITLPIEEKYTYEENIILSPTNTDSSNFQFEAMDERTEQSPRTGLESDIFFNEHRGDHHEPVIKVEDEQLFSNEQFQRYIDL